MGTRSLTVMVDEHGVEIAVMYRQYDGYPEGHGKELAEFLSDTTVVNGIVNTPKKLANGAECLAAQIVAHFKTEVGGIYLYKAGTRNAGEEYLYRVSCAIGCEPAIEVFEAIRKSWDEPSGYKLLYSGDATDVAQWCSRSHNDGDQ